MKSLKISIPFLLIIIIFSCKRRMDNPNLNNPITQDFKSDFLYKWIDLHLELIKYTNGYTPPVASRTIAYTYLALYESVVPGMPDNKSLKELFGYSFSDADSLKAYYWPASAVAAMASMLRYEFPLASPEFTSRIDSLELVDSIYFNSITSEEVYSRSIAFGRSVAAAVQEFGNDDGGLYAFTRNYPSNYTAPVGPGLWEPTPSPVQPFFHYKPAMQPFWGDNRPFLSANTSGDLILPPPPQYSTDSSSEYYQETNLVFNQVNNNSPEQINIAIFWSDDIGSYSPPGHSLAITKIMMNARNSDLAFSSELLCRLGMAVSDAFINCFKLKYIYNFVRPVTFIQQYLDPNWNTIIGTPPFPEYPSCHSTQSAAAARILTHFYGENVIFTDNSKDDVGYTPRTFNSFYEFAQEAAISRLYGGVHYNFSCTSGYENGIRIGENILGISFKK